MGRKSREKALRRMERQRHEGIQRGPRAIEEFGFEIETDRMVLAEEPLPPDVEKSTEELYFLIRAQPEAAIPRLEKLIEEYPAVPTFKNWLAVAYSNADWHKQAQAMIERTVVEHPNYLFAKVNLANIYLTERRTDDIALIFGNKTELGELYPQRKKFHITEFTSFYAFMARYAMVKGDIDAYFRNLAILKLGAPDSNETRQLEESFQEALKSTLEEFSHGRPARMESGRRAVRSIVHST
jgi:hypothetical protein